MKTKTIQLEIPDYLTIGQYQKLPDYSDDNKIGNIINTICVLTGKDEEEVKYWSIDSLKEVFSLLTGLADSNNEFHSIVEFNGTLYGYAHMKQSTLAEYLDLEGAAQDVKANLNKIAAILYRPITKHRFNSLEFITRSAYKIVKKKDVENVFDWYEIEKYNNNKRKDREVEFEEFPVNVVLGALSFFLINGSLYLNNIAYSQAQISQEMKMKLENTILESLSQSIGAGGGLSITSVNPIYYRYQGKAV